MEIIRDDNKQVYFGELDLGDVFEYDGELFIKSFSNDECCSLSLKTFEIVDFFDTDTVILKNAKLVIT